MTTRTRRLPLAKVYAPAGQGDARATRSPQRRFARACAVDCVALPRQPSPPAAATSSPFVYQFMVFVIAIFVGYYVVWSVTPALHTPLMSVTNAISSVIVVGALLAVGRGARSPRGSVLAKVFGFLALVMASVNIFGGFLVTQRMLAMYKKKEPKEVKTPERPAGKTEADDDRPSPRRRAALSRSPACCSSWRCAGCRARRPRGAATMLGMAGMAIAIGTTLGQIGDPRLAADLDADRRRPRHRRRHRRLHRPPHPDDVDAGAGGGVPLAGRPRRGVRGGGALYAPEAFGIGTPGNIARGSLIEMSLGVAIGAITFTGSVIAFAKLSGRMSGKPIILPARHVINLGAVRRCWCC